MAIGRDSTLCRGKFAEKIGLPQNRILRFMTTCGANALDRLWNTLLNFHREWYLIETPLICFPIIYWLP